MKRKKWKMKDERCAICGKNVVNPRTGRIGNVWVIDMKYGADKKDPEWDKNQLGVFAFLLDKAGPKIYTCWECTLKSYGLKPDRVKEILGGTFR